MSDNPPDWQSAPVRAEKIAGSDAAARGWINTETEEVLIRQPLKENTEDLPTYGVYFFLDVSKSTGLGTNRSLLFRDDDPDQADERIISWLETVNTPTNPDRMDTAISPEEIRREEISHVTSLRDWAHLTGADYYISEKIGNRKRSSGSVAIFDGSHRRGKGAYVAIAKENGPRGQKFASVGYQTSSYYTTEPRLRETCFDIKSPSVEFNNETLQITGPGKSSENIIIKAQTGNPNHSLNTKE